MKISIAMATFNGAKHLPEQLKSFAEQSRLPDELVVCDDQSTDATVQFLQTFRARAPFPVRLHINETRLGFTANFSRALSECSGDIVFLSDQDDVWYPEKISVISGAFIAQPDVHLLAHDADLVDEYLHPSGVTYLKQVLSGYGSSRSLATGTLTAVRRELLAYTLPVPDGVVGHDLWLHSIADMLGARAVVHKSLQSVRRHSSNTSAWVASSLQPISRLDVWKSQSRTQVAGNYADRHLLNTKGAETLRKIRQASTSFSESAIAKSLEYLAREEIAIMRRNQLASASRIRQKTMCLRMLLSGDYQFFNGYMSFFRDLAR